MVRLRVSSERGSYGHKQPVNESGQTRTSRIVLMNRRSQTIHYSFLNVDKHRKWMDPLLAMALGTRHSDMELNEGTSSHEPDYTGYVLALNGHKKYLCLFRPVHVDDKEDSSRSSDEDARAPRAGVKTRSKGSSRRQTSSTPHVCSKLERLSLWMERLMEGTLPRHYVPSWPDLEALQK
ncbi:hypothetical protein P4O66_000441 [Electrophorus voltai]|uniref:Uncharacterized protein n=1 Tax=Electrophorus voltai TaxID=2609070 RepID=A0AAD9E210_9TELE|nr:hypothetical protein P4O66_000441 [Electrophorus voltai]